MNFSQSLSAEQEIASYETERPVVILAGAGSGKTRVITHRIAHLVNKHGVDPYNILGVTFTNKAAREMRERVEKLLPSSGYAVMLGTFHGLAAKFLRYYGEIVGVPKDFLIYDEDDAQRLIKKILKERFHLTKDELAAEVKKVLRIREADKFSKEKNTSNDRAEKILEIYEERLKKIGAVDFFGLLQKFCELLENPEGKRVLCSRIQHIVVDEYQDINAIQSRIVHILAENAKTAAIVGDDDQSIYSWRGASAQFMQKFLDDFKDAKLFRLEENYRSTKQILDGANGLIANNQLRLGKNLRSMSGKGSSLRLKKYFRDNQEALAIIEQARKIFDQYGSKFDIGVLMRTNAQSRPLEEALHKARMPYRMVGGMRFYDRKEIKDILSALKSVLYENSDVDLLRCLNALPFGIGKKTQDNLSKYSELNGLSILQCMRDDEKQMDALGSTRSKKKIDDFSGMLKEMRAELMPTSKDGEVEFMRADEALIYVIDKFGFAARYEQKNDDESESRLENIEQLVQAAVSFVENAESLGEPNDIQSFLENVALVSKDESVKEENARKFGTITLMTLHAAKGLEFDCVFLIGLEDGVLPHSRSLNSSDEEKSLNAIEEERRLMYVGMTRARKLLHLSFCQERFLHGRTSASVPSRFLNEILPEVIDPGDRYVLDQIKILDYSSGSNAFREQSFQGGSRFQYHSEKSNTPSKKVEKSDDGYRVEYDPEFQSSSLSGQSIFKSGQRVEHTTYAHGVILSLSGQGKMQRAKVRFDRDGLVRTIMTSHLERLA